MIINTTYYNDEYEDLDICSLDESYITYSGKVCTTLSTLYDTHIYDKTIDVYEIPSDEQLEQLSKFINYNDDSVITVRLYENNEYEDFFYYSSITEKIYNDIKNWYISRKTLRFDSTDSGYNRVEKFLYSKRKNLCECLCGSNKDKHSFYDYLCEEKLFEANTDTTFGKAFNSMVDIIMKYAHIDFEEFVKKHPEEGFKSTPYVVRYIYNNEHTREFVVDELSKHINNKSQLDKHWHCIFFRFYSDSNLMSGAGTMNLYKDDIIISINLFFINNRKSAELTLVHELTHVLGTLSDELRNVLVQPNKQFYKSINDYSYEPANSLSLIKDELYSYIDRNHKDEESYIFQFVSKCLYYFSVYEQNSFKEETSKDIRYLSAYRLKKLLKLYNAYSKDEIAKFLIYLTFDKNRLEKMYNILKMINSYNLEDEYDVKQLCLFGYYLNRTLTANIKQKVIDKENIILMFNDYEKQDIQQLKIIKRQIIKTIDNNILLYARKLRAEVLSAYDMVLHKK